MAIKLTFSIGSLSDCRDLGYDQAFCQRRGASVTDKDSAMPEQIKKRVYDAYDKAIQSNMFMSRSGGSIDYLLRNVKIYGRDGGMDFVETHLDTIIQEAVAEAGCRKSSLSIPTHGFGRYAVAGMASKLGELTAMQVETSASAITLTWADTAPRMA